MLFPEYWPAEVVAESLTNGQLLKGVLRINLTNASEGYVTIRGIRHDLLVKVPSIWCCNVARTGEQQPSLKHESLPRGSRKTGPSRATQWLCVWCARPIGTS